jgi:peptidyl-prolyl cis-trans isomerase SurA
MRAGLASALVGILLAASASVYAQEAAAPEEPEVQGGFFAPSMRDLGDLLESPGPDAEPSESEVVVEGIAAQVGNGVVLVSEVRRMAAPIEARMRKAGAPESQIRQMRAEALERLIEQRLIEDIVRRAQLSATDAEVNQAVAAIARENGLTLEQMGESIASHGLTLDEYRAKIKSELERNKVLGSMVRSRVHIDDDQLLALYEQRYGTQQKSGTELHLRHILIAASAERLRDSETACRIAAEIRKEVVAGNADFEPVAQRLSDANAERGGDLGWVHADELAGWMTEAVEGLEPGQVSEVVQMPFGCNLIQLVERREFQPVTFEEAKPELEQTLFRQEMDKQYVLWIKDLRDQVYVERKGIFAEADRVRDRTAGE